MGSELNSTATASKLEDVAMFLLGEKSLEGRWFGETYVGVAPYWWRRHLREALQASQSLSNSTGTDEQRAAEILNRHCEYTDGMERGQRYIGIDNALNAVMEALRSPSPIAGVGVEQIERARLLAAEIMAKVRQAKIDLYSDDEHQDEFEALTLVPMIAEAITKDAVATTQGKVDEQEQDR